MKDFLLFESSVGFNSGSFRTGIPKQLANVYEIEVGYKILWKMSLKDNSLTLIFENTENDSSDIDEVTEKTTEPDTTKISVDGANKTNTSESSSDITIAESIETTKTTIISDLNIEKNPLDYFEKLKDNHQHTLLSKDGKIRMSIQKNKRSNEVTFKLNFRNEGTKQSITNITIGTLKDAKDTLGELSEYNSETLSRFIIEKSKDKELVTEKLKSMGIIKE